jgi:hypothetical protein
MDKAFKNWRNGAFKLYFPNGNMVSTIFTPGSYSDNYNESFDLLKLNPEEHPMESTNCEIMFNCGEKLRKKLQKKFNNNYEQPFGYVSITDWMEIISKISKEKKI